MSRRKRKPERTARRFSRPIKLLLEDEEYGNFVTGRIEGERMNAEFAAASAGEYFEKQFSELQDEYMRARAADVRDVTDRLLRALAREQKERAGRTWRFPIC